MAWPGGYYPPPFRGEASESQKKKEPCPHAGGRTPTWLCAQPLSSPGKLPHDPAAWVPVRLLPSPSPCPSGMGLSLSHPKVWSPVTIGRGPQGPGCPVSHASDVLVTCFRNKNISSDTWIFYSSWRPLPGYFKQDIAMYASLFLFCFLPNILVFTTEQFSASFLFWQKHKTLGNDARAEFDLSY